MKLNKRIGAGLLAGALAVSTLFTGCGNSVNTGATLVKAGEGDTITLGYYNFAARYQQAIYDLYYTAYFGEDMWTQDLGSGKTYQDSVKENVLTGLQNAYISELHAADYGIELTDEDKASIDAAADQFLADNSKKALKAMGATKEYLVKFLTSQFYSVKLTEAIRGAEDVVISDDLANQTTISYAYVSTAPTTNEETGEQEEKTAEEKSALRETANKIAQSSDLEAAANENAAEYSTYSFTTSADPAEDTRLGEQVIKAALALGDGETSDVIAVDNVGFYIIHMDAKLDADATATKRESLIETEKTNAYNDKIDAWKEEVAWDVDESLLSQIEFDPRYEMSKAMQEKEQAASESEE